jgi:hypothetical protein
MILLRWLYWLRGHAGILDPRTIALTAATRMVTASASTVTHTFTAASRSHAGLDAGTVGHGYSAATRTHTLTAEGDI